MTDIVRQIAKVLMNISHLVTVGKDGIACVNELLNRTNNE